MCDMTRYSSPFQPGRAEENTRSHGDEEMISFSLTGFFEEDVGDIVNIHSNCFPGTFLTRAGKAFLRHYYSEFSRSSSTYTVVARHAESRGVVGFAVGTYNCELLYRQFYYRSSLFVLLPLIHRMIRDAELRAMIFQRVGHVVRHLRPHKAPRARTTAAGPRDIRSPNVRLMNIAVVPEHRGTGLATQILREYERQLRAVGHNRVGLSVESLNRRAIAFYRKNGWTETHTLGPIWKFEKML